jgi:hypothetical protein
MDRYIYVSSKIIKSGYYDKANNLQLFFIFKRNTPQLAAAGIKGKRIQLRIECVSLVRSICGSALHAPQLAAGCAAAV